MWQRAGWHLHLQRGMRRNWCLVAFWERPAMDKTGIMLLPKPAALCRALGDLHAKIPAVAAPPPHRCPSQPCARQSWMTPMSHRQRGLYFVRMGFPAVSSCFSSLFGSILQSRTALSYSSGYDAFPLPPPSILTLNRTKFSHSLAIFTSIIALPPSFITSM